MTAMQLLLALVVAFGVSLLGCLIGVSVFSWFRSGERKEGHFRADQSSGNLHVDLHKGVKKIRAARPISNELPLVGGPAMIVAIVVAGIVAGLLFQFSMTQWQLLGILLLAMLGYGIVGFFDDWRKVHRGEGISEIQKGAGVLFISFASAIALNRLVISHHLSARVAYPPYTDIPILSNLFQQTHAWLFFFVIITTLIASGTSLAVDFSDGMDGLSGGLTVSAALAFAAILIGLGDHNLWPVAIITLGIAGAAGGFLPLNWPSSWKARNQGGGKRRARIIMGDSGSLALGGLLALCAVISRLEFVLLFIGGVFLLEGLSALVSARILVRFFRRFLQLERFGGVGRGFLHTEFPLPFLATPMHYHYDLLGWDRKRLVYGAWLLSAALGVLGVASVIAEFSWERYLARFVAFLVLVFVWQTGPWTRYYFIGLASPAPSTAAPALPSEAPRFLALYYGFPFKLFGRPLFSRVDTTNVTEDALYTPAERLTLWQRMSVFDARAVLGYYCYRSGSLEDALRVWGRIPRGNLDKRQDISNLLTEVRHTLAMQADGGFEEQLAPVGSGVRSAFGAGSDPNATTLAKLPPLPGVSFNNSSSAKGFSANRLRPLRAAAPGADAAAAERAPTDENQQTSPLWNAPAWAAATNNPTLGEPEPLTYADALDNHPASIPPLNQSTIVMRHDTAPPTSSFVPPVEPRIVPVITSPLAETLRHWPQPDALPSNSHNSTPNDAPRPTNEESTTRL